MKHAFLVSSLVLLAAATHGHAQSAWLPAAGEFSVTPGFSYSTFDEFWVGSTRVDPLDDNGESLDQYSVFLTFEYGITSRIAVDLTLGYAWTESTKTFGGGDDEGLADTQIGVRFSLLEESDSAPAIALRLGGVIAGSYDENTPFSIGDGADAVEASLLFGKTFGDSGFGAYADLGYRIREDAVPEEIFGSIGLYKQFQGLFQGSDALTVSLGYNHTESLDGLDIGGPGFNPARGSSHGFPAVEEVVQLIEAGLGYTDAGGRHYQFSVAKSVDGRNTGDKLIFGLSVGFNF